MQQQAYISSPIVPLRRSLLSLPTLPPYLETKAFPAESQRTGSAQARRTQPARPRPDRSEFAPSSSARYLLALLISAICRKRNSLPVCLGRFICPSTTRVASIVIALVVIVFAITAPSSSSSSSSSEPARGSTVGNPSRTGGLCPIPAAVRPLCFGERSSSPAPALCRSYSSPWKSPTLSLPRYWPAVGTRLAVLSSQASAAGTEFSAWTAREQGWRSWRLAWRNHEATSALFRFVGPPLTTYTSEGPAKNKSAWPCYSRGRLALFSPCSLRPSRLKIHSQPRPIIGANQHCPLSGAPSGGSRAQAIRSIRRGKKKTKTIQKNGQGGERTTG